MLRLACLAVLAAGCYNPKLGAQSFYCHEGDNPPCPEGQQCVGGRCQATGAGNGGHLSFKDMASPSGDGQDGGASGGDDMAHAHGAQDLAMPAGHDLSTVTGNMTGCLGLVTCENNCQAADATCPMTCQNNATAHGNSLFQTLINCVVQACPGNSQLDPCFNSSSTACDSCVKASQMTGGACESQVTACDNDTP